LKEIVNPGEKQIWVCNIETPECTALHGNYTKRIFPKWCFIILWCTAKMLNSLSNLLTLFCLPWHDIIWKCVQTSEWQTCESRWVLWSPKRWCM